MTTHDERPPALAGISLRTWFLLIAAMIVVWVALGYAVLQ